MQLGLTANQLEQRRLGIGSSDALKVIQGDWHNLWLEKTGRAEPKAILSPWDAAVRHTLEPLILNWYEEQTGRPLTRRGEMVTSVEYPFLRCILDGFDAAMAKPIDAKALNIYTPDPFQWCIDHYTAQLHHQCIVTNTEYAALHVSLGMREPQAIEIEIDPFFSAEYIERCAEFWKYVENDIEPEQGRPLPPPPPITQFRTVSMEGNNAFADAAARWLAHKAAAEAFEGAKSDIKALIEPDVGLATGYGVAVKRDGRGLTIRSA